MPPKRKQPGRPPAQATRQSARQRGKSEDGIPQVYQEMLAEAAEEEKASSSKSKPSRRQPTRITRRSAQRRANSDDEIPDVYREMLAEALAEEDAAVAKTPSSKRRKLSEEPSSKIELDIDLFSGPADVGNSASTEADPQNLQQITLTEFDTATESEVEFEDVDLEPTAEEVDYDDQPEQKPLELNLSKAITPKRAAPKRKPVGAAEKRLRMDVHRAHIVMLLAHLKCRNQWCNSESIQAMLKPLASRRITNLLHVDESKTQYERNQSFTKGIEEVSAIWEEQWTLDGQGMRRAYWRDDVDAVKESDDAEDVEFDDFKAAAVSKQGSRDLSAQLFCALLRSLALDVRLVCSLQVLPFSSVAKGQTPQKPKAEYIRAPPQDYGSTSGTSSQKRKVFEESMYPIFWVEVFSPAIQTWIPLDPIVRHTVNKPKTGFEPHGNDNYNRLTYVIALEDDGSAKDVTKRYTQFYNSKVRKQRVESSPGGDKWWDKTMAVLEKPFREARDDIEDTFLQKRAESEPMPNNIEDFRGHSIYVLERHLRKTEVIHPRRESGKVTIGFGKNAKVVSVFRRRDVHVCRTADAWYRRGRDVNEGEQPLKRAMPKRKRTPVADEFDDDEEAADGTALYAEFQTSLYEPPPAIDGKVPRNAYGNLDVYVPSMIPAGAVHVRHPLAAQAARILGIDYVDAVTGFQFKGRQGTAVVDGVVICMNMTHAMMTVIEGLECQASDEAQETRSRIVLAIWKRWLTALRVKEHVRQQYGDREEDAKGKARDVDSEDGDEDETYRPEDDGGGFMLEGAEPIESDGQSPTVPMPSRVTDLRSMELPPEVVQQAIIIVRSPNKLPNSSTEHPPGPQIYDAKDELFSSESGGFLLEEETGEGGSLPENDGHSTSKAPMQLATAMPGEADEEGGGFLPEDDDQEGGGFLPEDEDILEGGFLAETGNVPASQAAADKATASVAAGDRGHNFGTEDKDLVEVGKDPLTYPSESEKAGQREEVPQSTPGQKEPTTEGYAVTAAVGGGVNIESPSSTPTPGSLLSHDPDEDDAEPEWLLNSLGEID